MSKKSFNKTSISLPSLRLSSSTSLGAMDSKARRASAIAEATRKTPTASQGAPGTTGKTGRGRGVKVSASPEITTLEGAIRRTMERGMVLVSEKPGKESSALADFKVYKSDDVTRAVQAQAAWEAMGRPKGMKPAAAAPVVRYVAYPSVSRQGAIGSIAIYCGNADERAYLLRHLGYLFGHKVAAVDVRIGLRPFVDVRLRG